jgi:Uma2 family endonuclease
MATVETELRRIGPDCAGLLLEGEEFDAIEEWDELHDYELIRGVLVVAPIPLEEEASPNDHLGYLLRRYREDDPRGSALDATLPERYIATGPGTRRKPDRVIWAGLGRRPDWKADIPTIAVEFVSEGRRNWVRDYVTKKDEYLRIGVVEYWIIDRFARTMTVHRATEAGFVTTFITEAEVYGTPLLPGFELPLARLLEESDPPRDAQ